MQRRQFSRQVLLGSAGLALSSGASVWAQAAPKEGQDFVRLQPTVPVDAPAGQIEVLEFFSYGCIHCYHFEPLLSQWLKQKPADVSFKRVPVFAEPLQRAYYAIEAMGQIEMAHSRLFDLFFKESVRPASNQPEAMADWVQKAGINRAAFLQHYPSFSVVGKVKRASQLVNAYQVEGTPALGVGGKFMVPGQAERTLTVVNALLQQLRKT